MRVVFNDVDEFLQELMNDLLDPYEVKREVVRVTYRKRADGHLPICHVSVVAGYCNEAGELVELVAHMGQVMSHVEADDDVWKKASGVMNKIRDRANDSGLQVRFGAYADS